MKKFSLLLLPLLLVIALLACEGEESNKKNNNKDTQSSIIESSEVSSDNNSNTSSSNSDSSNSGESSNIDNSNTETATTKTFYKVVEVKINGKDKLESAGFRISSSSELKVTVTVSGAPEILYGTSANDIIAEVDVSMVSETGEVELMVSYTVPNNLYIIDPTDNFVTLNIKSKSSEITPPPANDVRIVNGVLISGTRAMEQFGGGASAGVSTAEKLNTFKKAVGNDVNVYILPAPLASAFYAPKGYERSITNHQNCFYGMRDALDGVKFVDTLSALSSHVDEDIYFRTDHHWQALGAYYCAEELASVAGVPFANITTFTAHSTDGMLGSFYTSYTHDSVLKNNPDTMTWYEPSTAHTVTYYSRSNFKNPSTGKTLFSTNSGYTKFIYGDSYTTHIKSNVGNGRKLLIFKDSYGNALAPFVVSSFDEVYIADYRYFELNAKDFIEEQGITDVCFELAAFSVAGSKRNYITQLLD